MHTDQIGMVALITSLAICSLFGNGLVIGIMASFKKLHTFPNILLASLSLADFLNAFINMPLFALYGVLEISVFEGKKLAIATCYFSRLFILLNLASMLVLLINAFLAIRFDLRYFTWKTKGKAMFIVLLQWFLCVLLVFLTILPFLDAELHNGHVLKYRQLFFHQGKSFLALFTLMFVIAAVIFGVLVVYSVRRRKLQRDRLNLPQLQAEARLKMDTRAAKTVAIIVSAFLLCYIPFIMFAAWGRVKHDASYAGWPGFLAQFSIFVSSGINPIISYFRTRRFRTALKQLLKDPCGRCPSPERKKEQTPPQDAPRNITRQGATRRKVAPETEEPRVIP